MDFMTVDTIFGKGLFLLIVLKLSTREIRYWDVTENPAGMHLIYDNAPQFTAIYFRSYGINGINTSIAAPNMKAEEGEGSGQVHLDNAELTMVAAQANAYVERVIGTTQRETLDYIILTSERRIRHIVSEYVDLYNKYRPHQGLGGIPDGVEPENAGRIAKMPILSGLHRSLLSKQCLRTVWM